VFVGWRGSFFFLALIPLATGLNVLFYLRREPSGDKTPETSGGDFKGDVRSVMKIKGTAFVIAAQSFIVGGTGLGVLITWMPQFLQDPAKGLGLSMGEAGLIVSIATVGGVVGTVAIGRVADQIGHLRTAMMCLVSTIVTVYLLAHYQTLTPILAPHLFIIGVTTFPIPTLLQSHLTTISTVSQRDILLGLYFTFGYGFSTLWSTIIGRIIDGFSFSAAWTLMSTLGLFALLMLFVAFRCQRM
jgi:predicted MFS family arabinose efflux permease